MTMEYFFGEPLNYELILPKKNNDKLINTTSFFTMKPLQGLETIYNNPFYPTNKKVKQNFKNPKDMTITQRKAFQFGYPPNMTMQDYVNWLALFQDNQDLLQLDDKINFQKLLHNQEIQYKFGIIPPPPKKLTPLNSNDYFSYQYSTLPSYENYAFDTFINPKSTVSTNTGRSTILAYNEEDYPNFSNNFDVYGTSGSVLNQDLWMKDDPKKLQEFVGPIWLKQNIHPFHK